MVSPRPSESASGSSPYASSSSDDEGVSRDSSGSSCQPHPHLCFALLREAASRRQEAEKSRGRKSSSLGLSSRIRRNVARRVLSCSPVAVPAPATLHEVESAASSGSSKTGWRCFTYEEIVVATNAFHPNNLLGRGGYSKVYKGSLAGDVHIAVKVLTRGGGHEERDFLTEVGILGHVSHPNAARLLGFCIGQGRHLVFECSPHGSLASCLHQEHDSRNVFGWPQRYKVALGVARGLHYLHTQCQRRIIHRDIKSSNILLGLDFEPQISDFGLAKWLPQQWTHHTISAVEGTLGYLAPEYIMHGIVDEKTDVYAYGVVLLELITGRKPLPVDDPQQQQEELVPGVRPLLESGSGSCLDRLVDRRLNGVLDHRELQRLAQVASMCIRHSAIARPSMAKVLELLEPSS